MGDKCPKCGMLKELCICDVLDKQQSKKIKVYTTKKKFRKLVTIVEGIEKSRLGSTTKELKHKLACGGSSKDGLIILQGSHKDKVSKLLKNMGYPGDSIEVS